MTLADDRVYLASLDSGIHVIDVSNPEAPVLVERIDTEGRSYQIAVVGNWGYVADGSGGLRVVALGDD